MVNVDPGRARVEELATLLRERDVAIFFSHGSLGRGECRAAEAANALACKVRSPARKVHGVVRA